ncbi:MAG TPA: DUF4112 domain-containing protein [Steroidobacteraceae bacterium]|jgi:hypothetical protein|nr:DUF4112 domain-containing protein [Steroidobacteraceae bacterium]
MDDKVRDDGAGEARGRRELERLRAIARLFDQAFAVPGTRWRFGVDALFGLVPGLGDVIGAVVAVYALHVARTLRAPGAIQLHMLGNIALDALVGTVPLIGDLFDFVFKAQTRNLKLLDAWMASPDRTARRSRLGLLLVPLAVLLVFIVLTVAGVWMLYLLFRGLAG